MKIKVIYKMKAVEVSEIIEIGNVNLLSLNRNLIRLLL
jgi:hypothetical protein